MTPPRKPKRPSNGAVSEALGPTLYFWDSLRRQMGRDFAPLTEEWVFSGQKHGWALRLKQKKRAVVYLKPMEQCFRVSLALGPKAVEAARHRPLPTHILKLIDDAVVYPEGKAVRLEVHSQGDVDDAIALARIKLEV